MTEIKDFVQAAPQTARMEHPNQYVRPIVRKNPITEFIDTRMAIVRASAENILGENPIIGRLLILASVSAFENYCRGILSGTLLICPIAQAKSAEKSVNLGGAIWHGKNGNFSLSAFEHKSFTDSGELSKTFADYASFTLDKNLFGDLFIDFDRIMHLRHAIVHADGFLPGRNAVKLDIDRGKGALLVYADQAKVQECLLILSNIVALINREFFATMCRRWAVDWRSRGDWKLSDDSKILNAVFDLFVDRSYNKSLPNQRKWGKAALKTQLVLNYNLG